MVAADPFHVRFGLHVDVGEAQRRFLNRVAVELYGEFLSRFMHTNIEYEIIRDVAFRLGEPYDGRQGLGFYGRGELFRTLHVIEALYAASLPFGHDCEEIILRILAASEIDLGIEWSGGIFRPRGAPELDRSLIDEPLTWIKERGLGAVYQPFTQALAHLVSAGAEPDRLSDAIANAYKSVEAMAQVLTGRHRDLSKNQQGFIEALGLTTEGKKLYNKLLDGYRDYANQGGHRHPPRGNAGREPLADGEAEAFVYFSGMLLRLAILALRGAPSASGRGSVEVEPSAEKGEGPGDGNDLSQP